MRKITPGTSIQKKRKGFGLKDFFYIIIFYAITVSSFYQIQKNNTMPLVQTAKADYTVVSPLADPFTSPTPTITPIPTLMPLNDQQTVIYNDIKQTFGQYTNEAMELLSCENSALNPDAINTAGNSPAGSMDIGVFQINNYWNDIGNVELLEDPQVNIAVAYHKFVASGYSFNQWTCGRKLGI